MWIEHGARLHDTRPVPPPLDIGSGLRLVRAALCVRKPQPPSVVWRVTPALPHRAGFGKREVGRCSRRAAVDSPVRAAYGHTAATLSCASTSRAHGSQLPI